MAEPTTIGPGMVVTLHVAMQDTQGPLHQATAPDAPLCVLIGGGELVAGLETRLAGEVAGTRHTFVIPPAEAYGPSDPRLLKAASLADLPVANARVGMRLATRDPDGELTPMTIVAIQDDVALLDLNPRFAGKTLRFDVEVVDVRPATPEEREAGTVLP